MYAADMTLDPQTLMRLQNAPAMVAQLKKELAKRSLLEFTRQAWPILEPGRAMRQNWVLEAMCEHLEAAARGEIRRLVINVPPGSSKSRLTRVMYPLWLWTQRPYLRIIGASYALQLAERDNYYARTVLQTDWYKNTFGVEISAEQGAKVNFDNSSMGGMRAISVGGATTGYRGDFFIVDDPHNVSKGESDAERTDAVTWFREAAQNRVNDIRESVRIVIMQRVHEYDVTSAALEMGYEHLCIPMRWDESLRKTTSRGWTDPRKKEGELMWPEMFPDPELAELEENMGAYAVAAQNQQQPAPRKGGMFDVDAITQRDEVPDDADMIYVRAWDLAGTEGAGAYTVGVKMGFDKNTDKFWIVDVRRAQLSSGKVRELIESTAEDDGYLTKILLPIDPGQSGKAQVNDLVSMLRGYDARGEAQSGSKEVRADPLAAQIERGHVYCLKRVWTKNYIEELRFFPKGKFKDQVDASASAFNMLAPLSRKKQKALHLSLVSDKQENWTRGVA